MNQVISYFLIIFVLELAGISLIGRDLVTVLLKGNWEPRNTRLTTYDDIIILDKLSESKRERGREREREV